MCNYLKNQEKGNILCIVEYYICHRHVVSFAILGSWIPLPCIRMHDSTILIFDIICTYLHTYIVFSIQSVQKYTVLTIKAVRICNSVSLFYNA